MERGFWLCYTLVVLACMQGRFMADARGEQRGLRFEKQFELSRGDRWNGAFSFRSNSNAFSASVSVTPGYIRSLFFDDVQRPADGLIVALAYAADIRPENWISYARGEDTDDTLAGLLSTGPVAETDVYFDTGRVDWTHGIALELVSVDGGYVTGEGYANARGNVVAFSRAYLHLIEQAETRGVDLTARSEARGIATSENWRRDASLHELYSGFVEDYESEAHVLAIVDADVTDDIATAEQEARATTDSEEGGVQCARVWLRGETAAGTPLTQDDLQQRGADFDLYDC